MSSDLKMQSPNREDDAAPPESAAVKRQTIWRRIVQRYQWMSLWNKIGLWAFVTLVIATVAVFQIVKPAYRHFKSRMYLDMADKFVEKQDYNAASLSFRKAILSGNTNPEVWKRVAAFLEKVNSPELAKIWETLAGLEPDVAEHKIRQAEAMLKNGRSHQAKQILDAIPEEDRNSVAYHRASAELAFSKRYYAAAQAHYDAWLLLEPDNMLVKFRRIITTMYSPDPLIAYPAKEEIEAIARFGGGASQQAYRELIARSTQEGDLYDASRLAGRLVDLPNPAFEDMASYLNLEINSKSFALQIALDRFLDFAEADPKQVPRVVNFLLERGQIDALEKWLNELPTEVLEHPDVQTTRFQIALATQDWPSAFELLKNNRLPIQIPPRVIELTEQAFAERAADDKNADQTWQKMLYVAQGSPGALQVLSLMAEARNWPFALGRTLAALSNIATGNVDVWRRLAKHEVLIGNLAGYHSALTGMMRINPYDIGVSSDWVLSGVLLRQEDPESVLATSERAYSSTYPANPSAATSYAMALLGVNQPAKAKEVIEEMTTSDRMAPERALYVGAIFAANGDNEQALVYLNRFSEPNNIRFTEELGFRRIWQGIARGEESASDQLAKIFSDRVGWQDESQRIALEVQRDIQLRYDPVASQRILEDLRTQTEERRRSPEELQQLMHDIKQYTPSAAEQ